MLLKKYLKKIGFFDPFSVAKNKERKKEPDE